MKNFFRSLRYLKPYRHWLAVSITCAIFLAVLWGGGLATIAPIMKVMIEEEGLHGWAWRTLSDQRMGVRIIVRPVPRKPGFQGLGINDALDIREVQAQGPGATASLKPGDWIVGVDDGNETHRRLPGDDMLRLLAKLPEHAEIDLHVWDPETRSTRPARIVLGEAGMAARLLERAAKALPEPETKSDRLPLMLWVLGVFLGINIVRDMVRFVQEYIVQATVWRAIMDLRCDNYNVALRVPVTFYAREGTSDTISRFVQDTHEMARGQITLFGKTIAEPAKAAASLAVAFYISPDLTLLTLVVGPPAFLLIREFGRVMKRTTKRALERWAGILGILEETLTGIRVVKTYTMESTERNRFFLANRNLLRQQQRIARIDSITAPTIEALGVTAGVVAAGFGGYMVLTDRLKPGLFFTWLACLAGLFDPLRKLAKVVNRFQRAEAAASRVFELQDQPQEKRVLGAISLPRHRESLDFRDVHYRYPNAAEDALRGVSLDIRAGQKIAIVGPNGCGKTTLVSLVPRLLDPSSGSVLIDGKNIAEYSLRSLRRQIGFVTQDTVLFNATIGENIAYGLRRPREEQVLEAARKAFVHEFVEDLPDGYDTMVGEHGATLSGGQKQRITIARAILRNPAILIFDEATSQSDSESEQRIHTAMKECVKDRTTLLVAHRFVTVMSADRVAVMDEGRILDIGTHKELLDRCEIYQQLYETQFIGE